MKPLIALIVLARGVNLSFVQNVNVAYATHLAPTRSHLNHIGLLSQQLSCFVMSCEVTCTHLIMGPMCKNGVAAILLRRIVIIIISNPIVPNL